MAESIGDIQLNISINVRNSAALTAINAGLSNLSRASVGAGSGVKGTTAAMEAQSKAANTLKGRLDAAEKQYDAIFRASYRLQNVGYGLVSFAQKMFSELKSLTDQWGQFEFMVNRAAGALQIWKDAGNGINPVYNALITNIESLTKDLRIFPAADVAQATYFWGSTTGQTVNNLKDLAVVMSAVNPLMKIAALTQTSYEAAIKGVYSILIQYHRPLTDVADVTAKLFVVTQRTALEFPDLVNAFKFVGPIAGALGVTFEEVAKTLGELGDAGIRGTQAGRALRQVFIQIERPTAKAKNALDDLFKTSKAFHDSFQNVVFPNGQFIGLTNFVNDLAVALQHATQQQRINFLATVTTANEFSVIVPLVENQIKVLNGAADAYDATKTSVDDAASAATLFQKSWDLLATSWIGITGRLKEGAEVIKLEIGRQLANALTPTIEKASQFLDGIEAWVRKNPEIVAVIGRLAASLAGLAAVAGGLFILSGSLLGLYAAIGVIGAGFGPLLAPGAAALGLLAAVAESIVRNFDLIRTEVVPAVTTLFNTLTGGALTTAALKEQWDSFHQTLTQITDFIVRNTIGVFTDLVNVATRFVNSGFKDYIIQIGQALVLAMAANSIRNVIGLTGALANLERVMTTVLVVAVLVVLKELADLLATLPHARELFLVFAAAVTIAVVAVEDLRLGFIALFERSPLVILTAIFFVLQELVNLNPFGIKDFFTNLINGAHDASTAVDQVHSVIDQAGAAAKDPAFAAAWNQAIGYESTLVKIAILQSKIANLPKFTSGFLGGDNPDVKALQDQIDALNQDLIVKGAAIAGSLQSLSDQAGVSIEDFSKTVDRFLPLVGNSFTSAEQAATSFYTHLGDGTPTVQKAVQEWNDLIAKGINPSVSKVDWIKMLVPKEELDQEGRDLAAQTQLTLAHAAESAGHFTLAAGILLTLKSQESAYGPDIQSAIEGLLSGLPKGMQEVSDATDKIANNTPGTLLTSLVAGFKALGDIPTAIKKAIAQSKKLTATDLVKAMFNQSTLSSLSGGFLSQYLGIPDFAQSQLDSINNTFETAIVAAQQSGTESNLAELIIKQYTGKDFQTYLKTHKHLSSQTIAAIKVWIDWAYGILGETQPSPATNSKVSQAITRRIPAWLAAEMQDVKYGTNETQTPDSAAAAAIASATSGMRDAWVGPGGGKEFVDGAKSAVIAGFTIDLHNGGYNAMHSWLDGVKDALSTAPAVIKPYLHVISSSLIGASPPPEGPLHTIDKGGFNIMKAWGEGLSKGGRLAAIQATEAANAVNSAMVGRGSKTSNPTLSFEHTNTRYVRVTVDVTSKDGSVDGLDMKTLGDSIKPDLIRELEHMAATN